MEIWPDPISGLTDASIVTVATTGRYQAVATFDQKLAKRLKRLRPRSVLVTGIPPPPTRVDSVHYPRFSTASAQLRNLINNTIPPTTTNTCDAIPPAVRNTS